MNDHTHRRCEVLIAVQQALLGEITVNIRAVTVAFDEHSIRVDVYVDAPITDEDYEAVSLVETELIAGFPDEQEISVNLAQLPAPKLVPKDRTWVFHRKEPLTY